jgi:hypothetical protein
MDPIEKKWRHLMTDTMVALTKSFPGMGVGLMVFDLDKPGRMNWISNANRADMIVAMKEFIARNEGRVMAKPDRPQ